MSKLRDHISLLSTLQKRDVQDLILELELVKEGYQVWYFIDQDDLSRFCFPRGLTSDNNIDERTKQPQALINDEQVTYYELFFNSNQPVMVLDEYLDEIHGLKSSINDTQKKGIELIEPYESLRDAFNKDYKKMEKGLDQVNIPLFVSVIIGALGNGIKMLNRLESEKKIIYDIKTLKEVCQKSIEVTSIIESTKSTMYARNLLTEISRKRTMNLARRISKFRDCQALDRVLQFNQIAIDKKLKCVFFLLSTSEFSSFSDEPAFNEKIPILNGSKINPLRSVNQLFFNLIFRENMSFEQIDEFKINESIETFQTFIEELIIQGKDTEEVGVNEKIKNLIDKYINEKREKYENVAILSKYEKLLPKLIKNFETNEDNDKVGDHFESVMNEISEAIEGGTIEILKKEKLNDTNFQTSFKTTLLIGLQEIKQNKVAFEVPPGSDMVSGKYHLLPVVFFIERHPFKEIIDKISYYYLNTANDDRDSGRTLINHIEKSINLLFNDSLATNEEALIQCLILLMIPGDQSTSVQPESMAYQKICEIIDSDKLYPKLKLEYLFVACWLARRLGDLKKAEKFTLLGNEMDSGDPRFYHSLCLIYYNRYENFKQEEDLLASIELCDQATGLYLLKESNEFIEKTLIALYNTKCYLNCLLFEISNDPDLLEKAYELNEKLKITDRDFDKHAEFLHTESKLYFLYGSLKVNEDIIQEALKSIRKAIGINDKAMYKKFEKEIEKTIIHLSKRKREPN